MSAMGSFRVFIERFCLPLSGLIFVASIRFSWLIVLGILFLSIAIWNYRNKRQKDLPVNLAYSLVFTLCFLAFFASWLAPFDVHIQRLIDGNHLLGLDSLGRDQFSRLLIANQNSLIRAGCGCLLANAFVLLYSFALNAAPKLLAWSLHAFLQVFLAFPLLLLFLLGASLGDILFDGTGAGFMIVLMAVALWAEPTKLTHARLQELNHAEFVQTSRMAGFSRSHILVWDFLPNITTLIAVNTMLAFISAMVLEAILGFLGLGFVPGEPNLGQMIYAGLSAPSREPVLFWSALCILFAWIFSLRILVKFMGQSQNS